MDRCSLHSDRYSFANIVASLSLTLLGTDLNGLQTLARDLEDLEIRIHDRWRHQQMQPYRGSAINWNWFYDSYEYRTWLSNTVDRVGNMLWLSDQDHVLMSLYLSNLVFRYESCLLALSHDIVYFYYRAPPPELDVELHSNSLDPLDSRGRPGSPPLAAVLCVFIAQIIKSRGGYFGRLSPSDHATLKFAFEATKVILRHCTNGCSPEYENPQQVLVALEELEDLLWSIFEGIVSAKRWRGLVVVLDGLDYAKSEEAYRFLDRLSKLQEVVSKAEGSLRSVISSVHYSELHRVFGKTFPGLLRLDRTAEMAGMYMTLGPPY